MNLLDKINSSPDTTRVVFLFGCGEKGSGETVIDIGELRELVNACPECDGELFIPANGAFIPDISAMMADVTESPISSARIVTPTGPSAPQEFYPKGEKDRHHFHSSSCPCHPTLSSNGMFIHNSLA